MENIIGQKVTLIENLNSLIINENLRRTAQYVIQKNIRFGVPLGQRNPIMIGAQNVGMGGNIWQQGDFFHK